MHSILVTGATGNVGREVIRFLTGSENFRKTFQLTAGIRKPKQNFMDFNGISLPALDFDFGQAATFGRVLQNFDILFLLRPPQLADTEKYFAPLIQAAMQQSIKHIVFLSVQGAETSRFIPHHKIEKLIVESRIPYTFLRPGYFMQNFNTTLHKDLKENQLISLPAGNARFSLVDVRDIGRAAAAVLENTEKHPSKAYLLTGEKNYTFAEMARILTQVLGKTIRFESPSLLEFWRQQRKAGVATGMILVLVMLHYLPRFQRDPVLGDGFKQLTGLQPADFKQYAEDYKSQLS